MKCPSKYGWIYDHKGAVSTTNWHLPRLLPMTVQQGHSQSASAETKPCIVAAVDLQHLLREWPVERGTLCSSESDRTGV